MCEASPELDTKKMKNGENCRRRYVLNVFLGSFLKAYVSAKVGLYQITVKFKITAKVSSVSHKCFWNITFASLAEMASEEA
jgi:hypothetical protein